MIILIILMSLNFFLGGANYAKKNKGTALFNTCVACFLLSYILVKLNY